MTIASKQEPFILLLGDILFFLIALWLTLFIRYGALPEYNLLYDHLVPFSALFVAWIAVYFISGLYGKHTTLLRKRLPTIIFNAQVVNVLLAALFFFFIPYFGITPKTNLVIYLVVSFALIVLWRVQLFRLFGFRKKQRAVLVGYSEEVDALIEEVNKNPRYNIEFVLVGRLDEDFDPRSLQEEILEVISSGEASVVVADTKSHRMEGVLSTLYSLTFLESKVTFVDIHKLYESIFDRIPLSGLNERWILENVSSRPRLVYVLLKRLIDIIFAIPIGVITLFAIPIVALLIKLDDKGSIFFKQERIGEHNKRISILKFRTMSDSEILQEGEKQEVTRVGNFLRITRIDELPQVFNVVSGTLSFIGPRPEIPALASKYAEEIPYYNIRHNIKPGLTGWAQIRHENHPHHAADVTETRVKLSYDLFYLKEKSLLLDLYIALQTIKTLLSRSGR